MNTHLAAYDDWVHLPDFKFEINKIRKDIVVAAGSFAVRATRTAHHYVHHSPACMRAAVHRTRLMAIAPSGWRVIEGRSFFGDTNGYEDQANAVDESPARRITEALEGADARC